MDRNFDHPSDEGSSALQVFESIDGPWKYLPPTDCKPDLTIFYTISVSTCKPFLDESMSARSRFVRSLATAARNQDAEELQVTSNKQVPTCDPQGETVSWTLSSSHEKDPVLAIRPAAPTPSCTHRQPTRPLTMARPPIGPNPHRQHSATERSTARGLPTPLVPASATDGYAC